LGGHERRQFLIDRGRAMHPSLSLDDERLLAECDVQTYRASGPGGQHRNKVESAVRIRHRPTGVEAVACDSRVQQENRRIALRRLREAIALQVREPEPDPAAALPDEYRQLIRQGKRIRLRESNPAYPVVAAAMLDSLQLCSGRVADAARLLGCSTHHFTQFLADHPRLWQAANQLRTRLGLKALRKRA